MDTELQVLIDKSEITSVIYRYCRGVDRRQYELIRSCYHEDATDRHGTFFGPVDQFVGFVEKHLPQYERTMHFIGNLLIEVTGDRARSESYVLAFHRLSRREVQLDDRDYVPARDCLVALRYVDDFERRAGQWRIANRVCAYEFTRTDPVPAGWSFSPETLRGRVDRDDVVFSDDVTAV